MLVQIDIRDLATIESLHLELNSGCSMITGETGAGKSIFIEAIELALGSRASLNVIRPGKEKADITLCFDITHFTKVINRLTSMDLCTDTHECIIRRVITQDGRSRCYINGSPAPLQLVKELGELLFHLHSQHEQHVLLKSDSQRDILDRYADHLNLANDVRHAAENYKDIAQQIADLQLQSQSKQQRAEYLRFQLIELNEVHLQKEEWENLEKEHHKLSHAEELIRQLEQVLNYLENENNQNILSNIKEMRKKLESIQNIEKNANHWLNALQSIQISVSELAADLQIYLAKVDLDPKKLETIEMRVSQLFALARKHKVSPENLYDLTQNMAHELQTLEAVDDELANLNQRLKIAAEDYIALCKTLSQKRHIAAEKLATIITHTIRSLSLPHSELKIIFEKETPFSTHGAEKIVFLIKTNPDQPLQPLAKAISGGELSRLSLAAHLALADRTSIPTLIFDEVDTGLSGATAEKIGKLLRKLGESFQVFCVSHQAQVAANGHHHVLVEKYIEAGQTHTRLRQLNTAERQAEIARMLGGEKITQKTLAHAEEMLCQS